MQNHRDIYVIGNKRAQETSIIPRKQACGVLNFLVRLLPGPFQATSNLCLLPDFEDRKQANLPSSLIIIILKELTVV